MPHPGVMDAAANAIYLARDGVVDRHNFARLGCERLSWGVYAKPPETTELDRFQVRRRRFEAKVRAIVAACGKDGTVLYGPTALQVLGVALPESLEDWDNCHILVPSGTYRPMRAGVVAHRSSRDIVIHRRIGGLPVLHPVDHLLQLRDATIAELIEVGDGLMRRSHPLLTLDQLRRRLDELAGVPGIDKVRRAAAWMRPGTDSLYESRTRIIIVRAGLPEPTVNLRVPVRSTGFLYHVDMGYQAELTGVEFDGTVHVGDTRQMNIDAARHRDLADAGWLIFKVTSEQLRDPSQFLHPLERALIMRHDAKRKAW